MVVPYALRKLMPKAKKLSTKVMKMKGGEKGAAEENKEKDPATIQLEKAAAEDAEEAKFLEKIYKEVDLEEYNIYTDYVEMVIQVRK